MLAFLNPDDLSRRRATLSDGLVIGTLAIASGAATVLGEVTANPQTAIGVRLLCAAFIIGAPVLHLFLVAQKTKAADEYVRHAYMRSGLSAAIWVVLFVMIMTLGARFAPDSFSPDAATGLIFAMPWLGASYAYIVTRFNLARDSAAIDI